jgi:RNA polymerase sigma factor (sigma-70 family)
MYGILRTYQFKDYEREDICQSAWVKVLRHLHKLQDVNRLAGWLVVLTKNEALRHAEKDGRSFPIGDPVFFDLPPDDEKSVESLVTDRIYFQDVTAVVHQLPVSEQRLLKLLMDGSPRLYTEISALLGIPRGSIGPNRARILARLRQLLLSEGLHP